MYVYEIFVSCPPHLIVVQCSLYSLNWALNLTTSACLGHLIPLHCLQPSLQPLHLLCNTCITPATAKTFQRRTMHRQISSEMVTKDTRLFHRALWTSPSPLLQLGCTQECQPMPPTTFPNASVETTPRSTSPLLLPTTVTSQ